MKRSGRKWAFALLGTLLLLGVYLSWQFGLFAEPHRAAPLVVPDPVAAAGTAPPTAGEGAPDGEPAAGDPAHEAPGDREPAGRGPANTEPPEAAPPEGEPRLNILLLGVDSFGERTRSDIMLLLSVDLTRGEAALLSIPRDTRATIPGRGLDKINHAHAFGGVDLALRTVANAFQVPIHHYVSVDMAGMVELIDALGPITVNVPRPLTLQDGSRIEPGPVEMDGDLALLYLRERYSDPEGDVGRSERAGEFLMDVARQLLREVGPTDIPRLFALLRSHADTDIRLQDGFWQRALGIQPNAVARGTVPGRGVLIDGIYYYEVDWNQTEEVLRSLRIRPPIERASGGSTPEARRFLFGMFVPKSTAWPITVAHILRST